MRSSSLALFLLLSLALPATGQDDPDIGQEDPDVGLDVLLKFLQQEKPQEPAMKALIKQGKLSAAPVAAFLSQASAPGCETALKVLEVIGDPAVSDAIQAVFQDPERSLELRQHACRALGVLANPACAPALVAALDDPWFSISEAARGALIALGPAAVEPLSRQYALELEADEPREGILYRGLLIFGQLDDPGCERLLREALRQTSGRTAIAMRHHAAIALGLSGDLEQIEPLISALERERDFRIAKYITRSLTWLTKQSFPPLGATWRSWFEREGAALLKSASKGGDDPAAGLGQPIGLPVDERGLVVLENTAQRAARLVKELVDPRPEKQRAAETGLLSLGASALPSLEAAQRSPDPALRERAAQVLTKIKAAGSPQKE